MRGETPRHSPSRSSALPEAHLQPPPSADPASSSGSLSSPPAPPAQGRGGGMLPESCQYCCQQFRRGNTRVRLLPKRRMAARVHSVLRREARGKRLSLAQCQLLRRYRSSTTTTVRPPQGFLCLGPHGVHAAGLMTRLGWKWLSPLFAQKA